MRISITSPQRENITMQSSASCWYRQEFDAHTAPQVFTESVAKAAGKMEDHREVH